MVAYNIPGLTFPKEGVKKQIKMSKQINNDDIISANNLKKLIKYEQVFFGFYDTINFVDSTILKHQQIQIICLLLKF